MKFPILKFTAALCIGLASLGGWPLAAGEKACDGEAEICVEQMRQKLRHRGWVGIELESGAGSGSPSIVKVIDSSPAAAAGLRQGDLLLSLDGVPYRADNEAAVREIYQGSKPGTAITYLVSRDGSEREFEVVLGHVPDYLAAQWIGQHMMHHHSPKKPAETAEVP